MLDLCCVKDFIRFNWSLTNYFLLNLPTCQHFLTLICILFFKKPLLAFATLIFKLLRSIFHQFDLYHHTVKSNRSPNINNYYFPECICIWSPSQEISPFIFSAQGSFTSMQRIFQSVSPSSIKATVPKIFTCLISPLLAT